LSFFESLEPSLDFDEAGSATAVSPGTIQQLFFKTPNTYVFFFKEDAKKSVKLTRMKSKH